MNGIATSLARGAILVAGIGFLLAACSAGMGAATLAPAASPVAMPTAVSPAPAETQTSSTPLASSTTAGATNPPTTPPPARPTAAPSPPIATPVPATRTPTATSAATVNHQVSEPDNGRIVTVPVGSTVTLVLHNTYWQVQGSSDAAVLKLVSGPTASGAGPSACIPGSGCGTVTATFRAVAPGSATVTAARASCGEALRCTGTAGAYAVTIVVKG